MTLPTVVLCFLCAVFGSMLVLLACCVLTDPMH